MDLQKYTIFLKRINPPHYRDNNLHAGNGKLFQPEKINVGALGNIVSQLHIHVIARFREDDTWPGAVWGNGKPLHYTGNKARKLIKLLTKEL